MLSKLKLLLEFGQLFLELVDLRLVLQKYVLALRPLDGGLSLRLDKFAVHRLKRRLQLRLTVLAIHVNLLLQLRVFVLQRLETALIGEVVLLNRGKLAL